MNETNNLLTGMTAAKIVTSIRTQPQLKLLLIAEASKLDMNLSEYTEMILANHYLQKQGVVSIPESQPTIAPALENSSEQKSDFPWFTVVVVGVVGVMVIAIIVWVINNSDTKFTAPSLHNV